MSFLTLKWTMWQLAWYQTHTHTHTHTHTLKPVIVTLWHMCWGRELVQHACIALYWCDVVTYAYVNISIVSVSALHNLYYYYTTYVHVWFCKLIKQACLLGSCQQHSMALVPRVCTLVLHWEWCYSSSTTIIFKVQNNTLKMGGHDGQPIPKLVRHLYKLLEHAGTGSHKQVQLQPVYMCTFILWTSVTWLANLAS